ncbi:MAG: hypothetical protein IPK20_05090 [Betaproteobacteria bacterium]|nr:hypothetical protein [Betaproteobacteria bacterium]
MIVFARRLVVIGLIILAIPWTYALAEIAGLRVTRHLFPSAHSESYGIGILIIVAFAAAHVLALLSISGGTVLLAMERSRTSGKDRLIFYVGLFFTSALLGSLVLYFRVARGG